MYHLKQVKLPGAPFSSLVGSLKLSKKDSACKDCLSITASVDSAPNDVLRLPAPQSSSGISLCPVTALQLDSRVTQIIHAHLSFVDPENQQLVEHLVLETGICFTKPQSFLMAENY